MSQRSSVLVGLGSPIRTDDAVGLAVTSLVHEQLDGEVWELKHLAVGGIELVESIAGYEKAVIVDAIHTQDGEIGDCFLLDLEGATTSARVGMTHEIGLLEGLDLGRRLGMQMPTVVRVYAVKVSDTYTVSEEMTPEVAAGVPAIVEQLVDDLRNM